MARSPKLLIFLTLFIDLLGFGIVIPILAPTCAIFVDHADAGGGRPGIRVALLMCAFSLLQMLFAPFWGRLSDRHGRRPILLASLAGSTLSYVLFAFARSYGLLLFSRILAGIMAANVTAALAYIADITEDRRRTAGMATVGIAFGLGLAFGPVVGGGATHAWEVFWPRLAAAAPHEGAGLAAALICGVNLVWAFFRLPESLPPERRGRDRFKRFAGMREALATLRHPLAGPMILMLFLVTFAFSNMEVSFSLYAHADLGMSLRRIYGLFMFIGLSMALTQGGVRQLSRTVPDRTLMALGAVLFAAGLGLLPLAGSSPALWVALGILSIGQGLCQPSILSLISRSAGPQGQGKVFGTSQSAGALARIAGPAFGGTLYEAGHRLPFWSAAAIMALAAVWGWSIRGRYPAAAGERAGAGKESGKPSGAKE